MSCTANAIGVGGLPGILAMQPQSMLPYAFCMLVAICVPCILTFIIGKRQGIDKEAEAAAREAEVLEEAAKLREQAAHSAPKSVKCDGAPSTIYAPMEGKAVDLTTVPDPVFASLAMGKGVAIEPVSGNVYAPVTGNITMLADTGHAIGFMSDDGAEVLLHIGIDTVEMNGGPFTPSCHAGQNVKAGDLVMVADLAMIAKAGKPTTTMVIVTNSGDYAAVQAVTGNVKAGEKVASLRK
jgi:PTS system sucrose-specific IIC component